MTIKDFMFRWKLRSHGGRPRFIPARTKPVERQLGVKKMARTDGSNNYPPESATGPGSSEMAITEAFSALQLGTTDNYKTGSAMLRNLVSEARAAWHDDRYGTLLSDARRACQDVLRHANEHIEESWQQHQTANNHLAHFREVHGLRYEPTRYEGRFEKVAVITAVMVGESLLNARMFGLASGEGFVGGFSEALIISFASVLFSAGAGYAIRYSNAKRFLMRRLGTAARLLWLPVIVLLHLLTGHYRDSLMLAAREGGADVIEAGRQAVASLLANPLALQDYHSMLLVLLGLIMAAFAAYEGYCLDDPYPDYGTVARQVAKAKRDHAAFKASILERFTAIVEGARYEVRTLNEKARGDLAGYQDEMREALDFLRKYAGMTAYIKASCIRSLRLYRELNALERSERCPAYFKEEITVPIEIDPELASELDAAQAMMNDFKSFEALSQLKTRANQTESALDALDNEFRDAALAIFDQAEGLGLNARREDDQCEAHSTNNHMLNGATLHTGSKNPVT